MRVQFATLHGHGASLVLEARDGDAPLVRHWGAATSVDGLRARAEARGPASFSLDVDVPLSLAPPAGLGWFGPEALRLRRDGLALVVVWTHSDVRQESDAIAITLDDAMAGVRLEQRIAIVDGGALRIEASVINTGTSQLEVEWLASALLPLPASAHEIVSWRGRHNAELVECREPMPEQQWLREGRRGLSSHGGPAGLFVLAQGATAHAGPVHALQLCWSGDSSIAVERDDEGSWILSAGAMLRPGEVVLAPGAAWAAPAALAVFSDQGRNGASAGFHAAVRTVLRWPGGERAARKVHLNSWEACYFDHDEERIVALAEAAAAIGIERFVLDDGWFRGRNDDTAGLGDWTTDPAKYPNGLSSLAQRVSALGMEFGLWVEPEMINPDSDLYRAHPDWALAIEGRARPTARNQLVLDMRRGDVRDYLFGCIDALLRELPIGYLKWDHNRDLAPAGGAAQVLGAYDLFARVRAAHPDVEIEACAGGGGRNDAGMAPHVHRYWTSDNIDAVSRVPMQRGFLSFLPPEVMGAHVGASPAHATGRSQSLAFRAAIAIPGHFGVEMDPRTLDDDERAALAGWIAFYKQWRDLLHGGQVWQGEGADGLLWQAQGRPDEFLLFAIRVAPPRDRRPQPLPLPLVGTAAASVRLLRMADGNGGHPASTAPLFDRMTDEAVSFPAGWLAASGLPIPPMKAETVAIFHVRTAPAVQ